MVYRLTAIIFAAFSMLAATAPAYAIGEDVFVVPRVPVQAQADSATQAKARAQAQGRRPGNGHIVATAHC